MLRRMWRRIVETLRRDFVAGLLVFVPIGFTILGVFWIINQLDNLVLPKVFAALGMESRQPPFVGAAVTLCVILLVGSLTRSFVGRSFLRLWESLVDRIPIARSLYTVLKQFMGAVLDSSASQRNFRRVVLIEYPRRGIYCYAFVTGHVEGSGEGAREGLLKIFVPSTPNPTTGYFLLVPESEVEDTGLSVEEAFKLIISAGIAQTDGDQLPAARPASPPAAAPAVSRTPST